MTRMKRDPLSSCLTASQSRVYYCVAVQRSKTGNALPYASVSRGRLRQDEEARLMRAWPQDASPLKFVSLASLSNPCAVDLPTPLLPAAFER
eukprot:scaffold30735_cov19-Tisochrysis_lutea.AAC.1